jgi:hypothetical protein
VENVFFFPYTYFDQSVKSYEWRVAETLAQNARNECNQDKQYLADKAVLHFPQ